MMNYGIECMDIITMLKNLQIVQSLFEVKINQYF